MEMTLEQVMALSGRELDAAVAERIFHHRLTKTPRMLGGVAEWVPEYAGPIELRGYSTSWPAAMQVREWVRGLSLRDQQWWRLKVTELVWERVGMKNSRGVLIEAEPIDFVRAALLLETQ